MSWWNRDHITSRMQYNSLIRFTVNSIASGTEYVTIDDIKRELNMAFDTPGSYNFDDDNTFLVTCIGTAREIIEHYTGLMLVKKRVTAIVRNEKGCFELPYSPITFISAVYDINGDAVLSSNYTITDGIIHKPWWQYIKVNYDVGYDPDTSTPVLPAGLKKAILHQIVWLYKNRGDQSKEFVAEEVDICASARSLAKQYARKTWLV